MNTAEIIKTAREKAGMTQETLAEHLDVTRQAVSKWEMGLSAPSPENLENLSALLHVDFSSAEGTHQNTVPSPGKPWKYAALTLTCLCLLLAVMLLTTLWMQARGSRADDGEPVLPPEDAAVTGVYFFSEDGKELHPDKGDGWNLFSPGSRVWMAVTFRDGSAFSVHAVSLFLTPTGTETFDQREQLAVQSVPDGRGFALFVLDVSPDLMGHLDVVLECTGDLRVTETLNVAAELLA